MIAAFQHGTHFQMKFQIGAKHQRAAAVCFSAGERYLAKLGKYGFSTDEIASHCYRHAEPGLEAAMSVSGEALLRHAAELARIAGASTLPLPDLVNRAEKKKIDIAVKLAELIRGDPSLVDKLPPQLVAAVRAIKELSA